MPHRLVPKKYIKNIEIRLKFYLEKSEFEILNIETKEQNIHNDSRCQCIKLKIKTKPKFLSNFEEFFMRKAIDDGEIETLKDYILVSFSISSKLLDIWYNIDIYKDFLPKFDDYDKSYVLSDIKEGLFIYKKTYSKKINYKFIKDNLHEFIQDNLDTISNALYLEKDGFWTTKGTGCKCSLLKPIEPEEINKQELQQVLLGKLNPV